MAREPQFCRFPQKPVRYFDKRSFRTVRTDGHRVVIGCKKGQWAARKKECKVGTEAKSILYPVGSKRCPVWKPLAIGAKELGKLPKPKFQIRTEEFKSPLKGSIFRHTVWVQLHQKGEPFWQRMESFYNRPDANSYIKTLKKKAGLSGLSSNLVKKPIVTVISLIIVGYLMEKIK